MTELLIPRQRKALKSYRFKPRLREQGVVVSIGDGIMWVSGLRSAKLDQVLEAQDGSKALVFLLEKELIGALLLTQTERLTAGLKVEIKLDTLEISVGEQVLGRVIDPLGQPLDGGSELGKGETMPLESASAPLADRGFVRNPLETGVKIVDTMIPIGKGQRQLLIGDNGLGKTSFALDVALNQKGKGVYCVYVLIAQKRSSIANIIQLIKDKGVSENICLVVAQANELPGIQYLAPFAGCAIAEYWRDRGKDALIIYDDLTAHADCYRELSLLLKRPPGREAFPADIFYLHSRLLERSTCLGAKAGGGSLSAFPIIETKQGQITSYIPTNLISITDGQIYFDAKLYASGQMPAIDITKSVSRIGGKAQFPNIRKEAGRMKLDFLQFLDLEMFTRFGAKLDAEKKLQIKRGQILREIFKQERLAPLSMKEEFAWMLAFNERFLDGVALEDISNALGGIFDSIGASTLEIDDSREDWVGFIKKCLEVKTMDSKKQ